MDRTCKEQAIKAKINEWNKPFSKGSNKQNEKTTYKWDKTASCHMFPKDLV
jgi:hypothetical protein